ncbi:MAG: DUF11 domain-containing protein [Omnitrophica WOR_2 bacterium]
MRKIQFIAVLPIVLLTIILFIMSESQQPSSAQSQVSLAGTAQPRNWEIYPAPAGANPQATTCTACSDDLSVGQIASAIRLVPGDILSYQLTVQNTGAYTATHIILTDILPVGSSFLLSSEGCQLHDHQVACTLESLGLKASHTFTIAIRSPKILTPITNHVTVTADQDDPDLANNYSGLQTELIQGIIYFPYLPNR